MADYPIEACRSPAMVSECPNAMIHGRLASLGRNMLTSSPVQVGLQPITIAISQRATFILQSQQPGTHIPAAALPTNPLQPQPFLRVQTPTPLVAFYSLVFGTPIDHATWNYWQQPFAANFRVQHGWELCQDFHLWNVVLQGLGSSALVHDSQVKVLRQVLWQAALCGLTRCPYSQLTPALHQSKEPPVPIYMNVSAWISVWVSPGIDFLFPVCSHMSGMFDASATMALLGMHHSSKELSSGICHVEHVNACNIPNIPSPCLSKLFLCITWY